VGWHAVAGVAFAFTRMETATVFIELVCSWVPMAATPLAAAGAAFGLSAIRKE
jgi:hypothetical protein